MDGNLRKMVREALPSWHWQSIESGGTGSGIPDTNFCTRGIEGWLEFKKALGWKVGLSPPQVAWLLRRWRAGGYCLVMVRQVRQGGDALYLYSGDQAGALVEGGLRHTPPMGQWVQPWPWPAVGDAIVQGFTSRHRGIQITPNA